MLKKKKAKNYAELENARVFHNPKTDLIEITGKYVDGENFSVVLPKGTKSDIKVRAELSAKVNKPESLVEDKSHKTALYNRYIQYKNPDNLILANQGILYKEVDKEWNWFCFPELSPGTESLFPLGIDEEGKPILLRLDSPTKNNIFLSNNPGSGGLMTIANLVYHVINFMPDTKLIHNSPADFLGVNHKDEKAQGRMERLDGLFLLDHLRKLRNEMNNSSYGSAGRKEMILMQDFDIFVDGEIANGKSSRTDKAVRAEILDLIVEISAIERKEYSICFVFSSRYMSDSMNAFLDSAATIMAYTRNERYQETSEPKQFNKIFGRSVAEMNCGGNGRGIIVTEDSIGASRKFATFINNEVVQGFAADPLQHPKAV